MQRKATGVLCLLGALSLLAGAVSAQSLATSARQLPKGSLKLLTFYQGTQAQDLTFSVRGTGGCAAAPPSNASFNCDQAGDVDAEGSGGMGVIKLVYQPWESLQYYGSVGVGEYSLSVPSATVRNRLTGDNPGVSVTFGAKAVIYPDTIVTPAIALDASITNTNYTFNRIHPGGTPGRSNQINQRLQLWQYQFAVESSHLFTIEEKWKLEPYGGVKWVRIESDLLDRQTGSHAGGKTDVVTPFLGLRLPAWEHEAFFAEASFVGGYQYAAGLELRF